MTSWRLPVLLALLLGAATLLVFSPAISYDFLTLDDGNYVYAHPAIEEGFTAEGVRIALTRRTLAMYTPVTTLSFMADAALFGLEPWGFHLVNVLLHSLDMALFFLLLWRMTGLPGRSFAAAALVALHPLRVESVAWVAERKDLLAVLFALLALACWLRFVRTRRARWYAGAAACFLLGLLSKPILVTFPLLLLLLDFWPLGRMAAPAGDPPAARLRRLAGLAGEKLPLLVPAAAAAAATIVWHARRGILPLDGPGALLSRAELVFSTFLAYLRTTLWPVGLSFAPGVAAPDPSWWQTLAAGGALALITLLALRARKSMPWLTFGWLWFVVALSPNARLLPTIFSLGDRFTYLPHLGLAVAVVWGVAELLPRGDRGRVIAVVLSLAAAVTLGAMTRAQLPYWRDSLTLYARVAALRPGEPLVHEIHAGALLDAGRAGEALAEAQRAVQLFPGQAAPRRTLARALDALGRTPEGIDELKKALGLKDPPQDVPGTLLDLGTLLRKTGKNEEGVGYLLLALDRDPGLAEAQFAAGEGLAGMGFFEEALVHLREAVRFAPADPLFRERLVELLRKMGLDAEAQELSRASGKTR